jgi:hypothetical protein
MGRTCHMFCHCLLLALPSRLPLQLHRRRPLVLTFYTGIAGDPLIFFAVSLLGPTCRSASEAVQRSTHHPRAHLYAAQASPVDKVGEYMQIPNVAHRAEVSIREPTTMHDLTVLHLVAVSQSLSTVLEVWYLLDVWSCRAQL